MAFFSLVNSHILARNKHRMDPKGQFHNSIIQALGPRCSIPCVHFNRPIEVVEFIFLNYIRFPLELKYPCLRDNQWVLHGYPKVQH